MAQAFSINSVIFRKTLAAGRKETNTLIFRCLAGTVFLGIEISVLLFYCRDHNGNRWLLTSRIFGLPDDADQSLLALRSEEHTSELQSLMRISYAVFCLKKKNSKQNR